MHVGKIQTSTKQAGPQNRDIAKIRQEQKYKGRRTRVRDVNFETTGGGGKKEREAGVGEKTGILLVIPESTRAS